MKHAASSRPDADRLFAVAAAQAGLFTTQQAAEVGYSSQLLVHHVRARRFARVQRGIYRLVHYPPVDDEEFVAAWLWSGRAGVVSHATAMALHGLSDVLPAHVHLTLPDFGRRRRLRVPNDVVVHFDDIAPSERTWFGAVPITIVPRTLADCARDRVAPDLLRQAAVQALQRGLVARAELGEVDAALAPFGGLGS
jgi:predicted transcriptional regulator of viral defense system